MRRIGAGAGTSPGPPPRPASPRLGPARALRPLALAFALGAGFAAGAFAQQEPPPTPVIHLDEVRVEGDALYLAFRLLDGFGQPQEADPATLVIRQDGKTIAPDAIALERATALGEHQAVVLVFDGEILRDPATTAWVRAGLDPLRAALTERDRIAFLHSGSDASPVFVAPDALDAAGVARPEQTGDPQAVYAALQRAIDALRADATLPGRKAVVLLTTAPDAGGGPDLDAVITSARASGDGQSRVHVYAITRPAIAEAHAKDLKRLTRSTTGDLFFFETAIHVPALLSAAVRPLAEAQVAVLRPEWDGETHEIELVAGAASAKSEITYPERSTPWLAIAAGLVALGALGWGALRWRASRGSHGRIVLVNGPRPGTSISLKPGSLRIGALSQNDIVIPSDLASRHHAELRVAGSSVEIADLDSRNGTLVNEERVSVRILQPGDRIRIANVEMVYEK